MRPPTPFEKMTLDEMREYVGLSGIRISGDRGHYRIDTPYRITSPELHNVREIGLWLSGFWAAGKAAVWERVID